MDFPRIKERRTCEFIVLYDGQTGTYLSMLLARRPNRHSSDTINQWLQTFGAAVIVDGASITQFELRGGLFGRKSRARALSLDSAIVAASNQMRTDLAAGENVGGFGRDLIYIPVFGILEGVNTKTPLGYKKIDRSFSCEPRGSSGCQVGVNSKIVSISATAGGYRLLLRDRYDVEVVVDKNLDLVSSKQLTPTPVYTPPPYNPGPSAPKSQGGSPKN